MINVHDVLRANKAETIEILKECKDNTIEFAKWDANKGHWVFALDDCEDGIDESVFCEDECPWVRLDGYNEMVVAVKLNDDKDEILVLSVYDVNTPIDEENEGVWYPILYCDGYSASSIYDIVGFWNNNKGF
jgi:hypothetical protein